MDATAQKAEDSRVLGRKARELKRTHRRTNSLESAWRIERQFFFVKA